MCVFAYLFIFNFLGPTLIWFTQNFVTRRLFSVLGTHSIVIMLYLNFTQVHNQNPPQLLDIVMAFDVSNIH
jgi:hypothetical protein